MAEGIGKRAEMGRGGVAEAGFKKKRASKKVREREKTRGDGGKEA
jgi:hypothetical protein